MGRTNAGGYGMTSLNLASQQQFKASRPDKSTWLSANAGSGKTKVLTDRVARLLLNGTPPQRILCLTYTKAAATEMQNRLFKTLGQWAMMPDEELGNALQIFSQDIVLSQDKLRHARTLFARAVETPGGLKIQTIHSFCSSILRRFPLEAGVSPQFREMDEAQIDALILETLNNLALGENRDAFDQVALHVGGLDPFNIAKAIIAKRESFFPEKSADEIDSWFNIPMGFSTHDLLKDVFLGNEHDILNHSADLMRAGGGKTDVKNAVAFRSFADEAPSLELVLKMAAVFIFNKDTKTAPLMSKFGTRSSVPTKGLITKHPDEFHDLENLMKRVEQARNRALALQEAQKTKILHRLAQAFLPDYIEAKSARGMLDFDDMIVKTRDLLSRSSVAQWVLFRLDDGIDHILVDEAQDTSPNQWKVISQLAAEFTAGEGAREDVERTIFVVGDKKQSIYSFQGAAPDAFDEMKKHFAQNLLDSGRVLQDLALLHSFRSSQAILQATDAVFQQAGGIGLGGETEHIAFFDQAPGRVDLWDPIEPSENEKDPEDWENPVDVIGREHHHNMLSNRVANFVANLLENGSVPRKGDENTAVQPRDILILVRKRSGLFNPLLRALKSHPKNIPIAGSDRLTLNDELAVKDIKSLLSFLSLQDDDLALAEILKSPIFGWTERDLYRLAHGRTTVTLWRALFERREEWPETVEILDDLRGKADFLRPYEVIERVLIRHNGRKKFLARLGKEAEDGIDALLQQAQIYETTETPSLTGFVAWLETQNIKLKRVLDEQSNLVRVMSSHGSKGLEAPIVILPDTMRQDRERQDTYVEIGPEKMVWKSASSERSTAMSAGLESIQGRDAEEENRLLYVAMTRAESWLVVGGAGKDTGHWHQMVRKGLEAMKADEHDFGFTKGLRHQHGDWPARNTKSPTPSLTPITKPTWLTEDALRPSKKSAYLSPSDLGGAKALQGEENGRDSEAAMRYGRQLHKLIEILPEILVENWKEHSHFILSQEEDSVLESELPDLLQEASGVINNSYNWDIFGENSLAEVPFFATLNDAKQQNISGIIDRMIVTKDTVQIVDFKSNCVIPDHVNLVPEGVLRQLGAYALAAQQIFPNHTVEVGVLWTRTALLMPVPLDMVRLALGRTTTS